MIRIANKQRWIFVSFYFLFSLSHNSFEFELSFLVLFDEVASVVEVTEENDEAERICQNGDVHRVREVTVSQQIVAGMDSHYEKLEL